MTYRRAGIGDDSGESCSGERAYTTMLTLNQALEQTRTGDLWLFRGGSGPDRAIQTLTNSP